MSLPIVTALTLSVVLLASPAIADDASAPGIATPEQMMQACLASEKDKGTTKTDLEMQQYCLDRQARFGATGRHIGGPNDAARGK